MFDVGMGQHPLNAVNRRQTSGKKNCLIGYDQKFVCKIDFDPYWNFNFKFNFQNLTFEIYVTSVKGNSIKGLPIDKSQKSCRRI